MLVVTVQGGLSNRATGNPIDHVDCLLPDPFERDDLGGLPQDGALNTCAAFVVFESCYLAYPRSKCISLGASRTRTHFVLVLYCQFGGYDCGCADRAN